MNLFPILSFFFNFSTLYDLKINMLDSIKILGVFTNSATTFFIDVLTWSGQQKAPETLFQQHCVSFIDRKCHCVYKECKPPPSRGKLLSQGRVLLSLEFYRVYLPLSLVDMLQVIGGGFGTQWFPCLRVAPPLLGCLLAWTLVLVPYFLFLSLSWVLSFYEVWVQGFINKTTQDSKTS